MCQQMASAVEEQRAACRDIAANGDAISERIESIQRATADHTATSHEATETLEALFSRAQEGSTGLPQLAAAVGELQQHGESMAAAMGRFDGDDPAAPPQPDPASD